MKSSIQLVLLVGLVCVAGCSTFHKDDVIKTAYYHAYGPKVSEADWQSHGSNGEVVEVLKSGIEVRREYHGGVLHGTSSWAFPYSRVVERTEEYENGNKFLSSKNYETGAPQYQEQWLAEDHRIVHAWYEDGAPRVIEEYRADSLAEGQYFTQEGEVEGSVVSGYGTRIERSRIGILLSREQAQQGVIASRESFYSNGQVREVVCFTNSKRHGQSRRYAENGEPLIIEMWNEGALHGMQLMFESGQPVRQTPYVMGKKEGIEYVLQPGTDNVVEEISWHSDQRHGVSRTHLVDQTIVEWFWRGGQVTEEQFAIRNKATLVSMKTD